MFNPFKFFSFKTALISSIEFKSKFMYEQFSIPSLLNFSSKYEREKEYSMFFPTKPQNG